MCLFCLECSNYIRRTEKLNSQQLLFNCADEVGNMKKTVNTRNRFDNVKWKFYLISCRVRIGSLYCFHGDYPYLCHGEFGL
jgi:hypothetical protein